MTVRVLQSAETRDDVVNEATVTVTDPANPDIQLTASDTDTDDLLRQPAIQVVKSADRATVSAVGETVTYEFVVTNPGDVTLSDITVTETAFTGAGTPVDIVCPAAAPLAPGASVTCTAEYDVVQADLDTGFILNTATVTGTPPAGLSAVTSLPSMAVVGADVDSALTLTKTASPSTATSAGDEISYELVVTNAGTVSVTDIAIVETDFSGSADGLSDIVCDQTGSVALGGTVTCSATYVLTQTDVDAGAVTNTASATADAPGSVPDPTSDPATAVVTIPAEGALSLDKTVGGLAADEAGDTVTYLFAVTNTGNVTLDDIAVSESSFTGAGDDVVVDCPAGALAPGAETTCVGTYVLVQEDVDTGRVDNTGVATAVAPDGDVVTSDDSSAELLIPARAALTLLKSATPTDLVAGEEITYTFVITNAGNVTVTDAEIREEDFTGSGSLSTITCDDASSLAPGEQAICSATYVITQDDVDSGRLDNTAVAQGEAPAGTVSSAPSTVQLPIDPEPSLEVVKTADVTGYRAVGDAIGYSFRVTNTGNVTIEDVSIVEESFSGTGELTEVVCAPGALAPGAYLDCTADYAVTQADLDAGEVVNTAHAGAASVVAGEPIVSDASTVTVPFVGVSALALTKSGAGVDADDDARITAGDAIRWTFLVTNTGATTVTDLDIDDPMIAGVTCEATVLTPGASVACVGDDYEITAADAEAGTVRNTATATGLGVGGVTVSSAEATAAVEVEEQPVVPGLPDLPGLPVTGGELAVWLIVLAVLLVLAGAVVIHLGRRRVAADE